MRLLARAIILTLIATLPAYAVDMVQVDRDGVTTTAVHGSAAAHAEGDFVQPFVPATPAPETPAITLQKLGNYVYVRTAFSATSDLVQRVLIADTGTYSNNVVDLMGAALIPVATAATSTASAYSAPTATLSGQTDEAGPAYYNGTYIGANHGANFMFSVTATGHGKTTADLGSEWTSGGRKWYLLRVVDANTLWLMSENIGTAAAWNFATSLSGTLTHSSGATNTADITVSSATRSQLYPATQNQIKAVILDGVTPVTADGVYTASRVDVVNNYDIASPAGVIDYAKSHVGTQIAFNDPAISSDAHFDVTYRFAPNGSITVYQPLKFYSAVSLANGFTTYAQTQPMDFTGGKSLSLYAPKVAPIVGVTKTWNLAAVEDISSYPSNEYLAATTSTWLDVANPPDKTVQVVKSGGTALYGVVSGISPLHGIGITSTRKNFVTSAFVISTSKKQYNYSLNGDASTFASSTAAAGSVYDQVAYKSFFNAATLPEATLFTYYYDGDNVIVLADFHQSVTAKLLPLPASFTGMEVSVIEKSSSASLSGLPVLTSSGVSVTVTGGYGYVSLRLHRPTSPATIVNYGSGTELVTKRVDGAYRVKSLKGSNITVTDDGKGSVTLTATGATGAGNVTNTGASLVGQIPKYTDTTGSAIAPAYLLSTSIASPGSDTNIPTEKAVRSTFLPLGGGTLTGQLNMGYNGIDQVTQLVVRPSAGVSYSLFSSSDSSGAPTFNFDAIPSPNDGTKASSVNFGRNTNASSYVWAIYRGDGTSTKYVNLSAKAQSGYVNGSLRVGDTTFPAQKFEVAGNILATGYILDGYEEKTASYTVSKDTSKITLASGTATVTLPKTLSAGATTSVLITVAGAAASGVSFAVETGGSISWGDAGAPTFTNSRTRDVVCTSGNVSATTTAAWRCTVGGNF